MLRIRVATSPAELEQLRPHWEYLYANGSYTLFQSYVWNRLAVTCFSDRLAPYVVCCETEGGLALVPAAVTAEHRLTLLGEEMFDYRNVLSSGDGEALAGAWKVLAERGLPFGFHAVTEDSATESWGSFALQPFTSAPQVYRAATSADQFVSDHPLLARMWRKAQRAGAELRQYAGSAAELVGWICRHKAAHHRGPGLNLFADTRRVEWVAAAAAVVAAGCEVFTLEAGPHTVAALITFLDFGVRRFYAICYDRSWAALSPGSALIFEVTRRSLQQELDCDYMTGEQPYKLRLANGLLPLYRVEVGAGQLPDGTASRQECAAQAA